MASSDNLIRDPEGGGNQRGLRDRNARVVLSFIRRHGEMPGAEIARRSGLSAQTVSNILRALDGDGLLRRGDAIRGKVGKPSIPVALNPRGVLSLGLNIGRRAAELVLVDFTGARIDARTTTYAFPTPEGVFAFLEANIATLLDERPGAGRVTAGIGVACPNRIWNWLEQVQAPRDAMDRWKALDLKAEVSRITGLDVELENDAISACVAEHLLGRGRALADFAYFFVGSFIGGGLVLNGKVVTGATHNAAAIGPLPVPDGRGGLTQLLNVASLHVLERTLAAAGIDPQALRSKEGWDRFEPHVGDWIETTARNLAIACAASASIVEIEAILIDGAFPDTVRDRLTRATAQHFAALDLTGLDPPEVMAATVGRTARSVGAALLPIHAKYFLT